MKKCVDVVCMRLPMTYELNTVGCKHFVFQKEKNRNINDIVS